MGGDVNVSMKVIATLAVLLVAAVASAQPANDANPVSTVVIPMAGNILGANGVRWKTDLEIYNDQPDEVVIAIELVNPTSFVSYTLAAGDRLRFTDVVGEVFGNEGAISPIIVRTLGRRPVSIRASTYGVRGTETFPPSPIAVNYRPTYFPTRLLDGLAFSDVHRTNIGLANLGTKAADFTLALQRVRGRNVAVTRVTIPPQTLEHFSIQWAFPLITKGDHFAVLIETGATETYVYGSVVENSTNIARFVDSLPGP